MRFSEVVSIHPRYGYKYLNPMPTDSELAEFYDKDYYNFSADCDRAQELRRFISDSPKAEINWLSKTMWSDVYDMIDTHLEPRQRTVLDFGCGTGHFAKFLVDQGCNVAGIDSSEQARGYTRDQAGISVYRNIKEFGDSNPKTQFNVVTMLNVLEHVIDPEVLLSEIKPMMSRDGLIIVRVPNDFSVLQAEVRRRLDIDPWWISYPDHISYFGFESLSCLLENIGFKVIDKLSDFPMELFLLLGDNYIDDPSLGKKCHRKRRDLELALPNEIRRDLYKDLAERGIGRNCLVVARLI